MLAFRSFVAVLVAVLTLLGGASRATAAVDGLHGRLTIQRASGDDQQTTLDRGRAGNQVRATKPSAPPGSDSLAMAPDATHSSFVVERAVDAMAAVDPGTRDVPRRVRVHVENMVFLN